MITNEILLPEVIRSRELGSITPELAVMLNAVIDAYCNKLQYRELPRLSEAKAAAVKQVFNFILKFNPERSDNPIAFVVTCARCAIAHDHGRVFRIGVRAHDETKYGDKLLDAVRAVVADERK